MVMMISPSPVWLLTWLYSPNRERGSRGEEGGREGGKGKEKERKEERERKGHKHSSDNRKVIRYIHAHINELHVHIHYTLDMISYIIKRH